MILRVDHVAIAVREYDKALKFFTEIFGAIEGTSSADPSMNYIWQNINMGDLSRMELLAPTGENSFLDGFLKDKEGGVHHITMQTDDIEKAKDILEKNDIPYFGYNSYSDAWRELFIHPKNAFGVLIQIAEFRPDDWLAESVKMPKGKKFILDKKGDDFELKFAHPGGGTVTIELTKEDLTELKNSIEKI